MPSPLTSDCPTAGVVPKSASVQSPLCVHTWIETPALLFTYQLPAWSIATGPPWPLKISGHSATAPLVLFTPAAPFTPSPASNLYGVAGDTATDSDSASEPRLPFKLLKCAASAAEHTEPVSAMPSVERHSPLSLPTNTSSGFAALQPSACGYGATFAPAQVNAFVVLRHTQPVARLHFHRSALPASSIVSCPCGTAASASV